MAYDKYERYGAYHWRAAAPGFRFWRYAPQSDANYIIALRQLQRGLPSMGGRPPRVLDIACGDGVMTYRMRRAGLSVVGIDLDHLALRLARRELGKRRTTAALLRASCMALPFADGSFDGVVAMELIEHLDPHLNQTFLSEIRRVLRPAGVVAITTPHKQTPELRSAYHTQEFSAEELQRLLGGHFANVQLRGYYAEPTQRRYAWGGRLMRPVRLLWKTLFRVERLNPFTRLTTSPTVQWEHVIAVARAEPRA